MIKSWVLDDIKQAKQLTLNNLETTYQHLNSKIKIVLYHN